MLCYLLVQSVRKGLDFAFQKLTKLRLRRVNLDRRRARRRQLRVCRRRRLLLIALFRARAFDRESASNCRKDYLRLARSVPTPDFGALIVDEPPSRELRQTKSLALRFCRFARVDVDTTNVDSLRVKFVHVFQRVDTARTLIH